MPHQAVACQFIRFAVRHFLTFLSRNLWNAEQTADEQNGDDEVG
ncbi:MAG: hypothetical protein N0E55_16170 [Candidatus Thiodiazotropha taylori]|nr:hypothetical protein [Candidatus Thiodiazotropha taylori]